MDEYAGISWRGPRQREGLRAEHRFDVAPVVTTHSHREAYDLILQYAGASLPKRDAVDRRLVNEVTEAGLDSSSPKQLIKKVLHTLIHSDRVEEIYGTDVMLKATLGKFLGQE